MLKFVILLAGLLVSPLALAHAHLIQSSPANNAVITTSPDSLQLKFSEGVEPALSTLTLNGDHGQTTTLGTLQPVKGSNEKGDERSYTVSLPHLTAGHYRVEMKITSIDTHRVTDTLEFVVK